MEKRPKVLIVDDDKNFRISLKEVLESKGFIPTLAANYKEATEILRNQEKSETFDIGLIDLQLPDSSGLELIPTVKDKSPNTELIVLTGHASLPSAIKAMNLGAFGYLEKPYNVDRLFLIVERALERQRLLRNLEESEAKYRRLFEDCNVALFLLDLDSLKISNINRAFTNLTHYNTEDLLKGITFEDFHFPEGIELLNSKLKELKTQGTVSYTTRLKKRYGNFFAEIHLTSVEQVVVSKAPRAVTALGGIVDVTKHRAAEEHLQGTKRYLEAIINSLPVGVIILDSEMTVIDCNQAALTLLSKKRDEVIVSQCFRKGNKTQCIVCSETCSLTNAFILNEPIETYHDYTPADGKGRTFHIRVIPINGANRQIHYLYVIQDITSLKTQEKELVRLNEDLLEERKHLLNLTRELEKANIELKSLSEAKSEFVSSVSHELRTPLTAILEGVSLLEDGSLGTLNSDQRQFLKIVKNNTKRLTELITNLLDLSKIEAGRMETLFQKTDLRKLTRELAENFQTLLQEKALKLNISVPRELSLVYCDERMVFRVFVNLLGNAVKFTPSGGTITISAEIRQPPTAYRQKSGTGGSGLADSEQFVRVSITDTGIGIPKAEQHKIFSRFCQIRREKLGLKELGPATKSKESRNQSPVSGFTGTGLGLALCKELIELQGGTIGFQSEENKGSKFYFDLPIYNEKKEIEKNYQQILKSGRGAAHLFKFEIRSRSMRDEIIESIIDIAVRLIKQKIQIESFITPIIEERELIVLTKAEETALEIHKRIKDVLKGATFIPEKEKEVAVKFKSTYLQALPNAVKEEIGFDKVYKILKEKLALE